MTLMSHIRLFILILLPVSTVFSVNVEDNLLVSEKNTIEIFRHSSPKVVYIQRLKTVVNAQSKLLELPEGTGSGIIWDNAGHIVTNYHVIKDAHHIAVTIGKQTVHAKVIGAEPRKDIAVLQLISPKAIQKLKDYKPFEIAPTSELLVGQKAIAIGNPFGFDHSMTTGIISAVGRQFPGVGGVSIHHAIQTDAAINPGNSGGPLLDSKGRLVGLNTAIFSQNGSSAGIGFAVPSDDIARIVPQIIQHGRVALAGIGIERVNESIARKLGVKNGILIGGILPNTPAAHVGLKSTRRDSWGRIILGDVIIAANDKNIHNYDEFYNMLSEMHIGDKIAVTVKRKGKQYAYQLKTIDIAAF